MLRSLSAVLFPLCFCTPAAAQCLSGTTPVWPTELTFLPAQPDVGEPVTAVLGFPTSGGIENARAVRIGASITLLGTVAATDIGVPPPPFPKQVLIGGLARGTYTVTTQLVEPTGAGTTLPCLPLQAQLVVGGGGPVIETVPALSRGWPLVALAALLLLLGWRRAARA